MLGLEAANKPGHGRESRGMYFKKVGFPPDQTLGLMIEANLDDAGRRAQVVKKEEDKTAATSSGITRKDRKTGRTFRFR